MRTTFIKHTLLAAVGVAAAIIALPTWAVTLPSPLVDAQWLHDHINDVTVVDIRDDVATFTAQPRYGKADAKGQPTLLEVGGHVPGARLIAFGKIRTAREIDGHTIKAMLPTRADFQALMRAAGVNGDRPIVISSAGDSVDAMDMAARLYWSMKVYGDTQVAILNGGTAGWLQAGYPVSSDPAKVMTGTWTAKAENHALMAGSAAVAKARQDGVQLVDARPTPQFLGIVKKPIVLAAGHIAGAHSFPTDAITRSAGVAHYFMTAAEYDRILPEMGIKTRAPTITYCNTGHLASGAWFVMSEVLGDKTARLYDGSMLEWTTEGRPVVPAGS